MPSGYCTWAMTVRLAAYVLEYWNSHARISNAYMIIFDQYWDIFVAKVASRVSRGATSTCPYCPLYECCLSVPYLTRDISSWRQVRIFVLCKQDRPSSPHSSDVSCTSAAQIVRATSRISHMVSVSCMSDLADPLNDRRGCPIPAPDSSTTHHHSNYTSRPLR